MLYGSTYKLTDDIAKGTNRINFDCFLSLLREQDCNNHVKSAMAFFGISCAVDSLGPLNNPLGDNSNKFCELCGSDTLGIRCTNRDPYAEYFGALKCLQVF